MHLPVDLTPTQTNGPITLELMLNEKVRTLICTLVMEMVVFQQRMIMTIIVR